MNVKIDAQVASSILDSYFKETCRLMRILYIVLNIDQMEWTKKRLIFGIRTKNVSSKFRGKLNNVVVRPTMLYVTKCMQVEILSLEDEHRIGYYLSFIYSKKVYLNFFSF